MHQPRSQQDRGLFLGLFALYACFRLYAFYLLPRHGYIFSHDAAQYLEYAHCSLISPCLYIDRPFIFPLFIKIWGYHYFCLTWAQCCISIMAWGFLAYSMKQSMQTRLLARFIFCFILIYSCAAYLILWDTKALTESLSVSFLVCFIAFYLIGLRTQFSIKSIVGLMLFGFLLVNIRDSNSYLFLLAGIGTGIASFISKNIPKKPALILLAFSIMVFLFSTWTANLGLRWLEPISDLLANRIIADPDMTQYFLNHGMPNIISQLQSVEGGFGGFNVVLQNPAWFIAHSRSVYVQYLISHPAYTLSMYVNPDFWQDILFAPSLLYGYACYGFPLTSIPSSLYILINYTNPISAMINAICPIGIVLLLISGLITYMEHFAKAQANLLIRFSELLIALTIIILASNVWLLEPMEDMRHQLNNHLLIVIGIILFSCKSLDYARLQSTNLVNR